MNGVDEVLRAVASELADLAKSKMPPLSDGETIQSENLKNGVYVRETLKGEKIVTAKFDFSAGRIIS